MSLVSGSSESKLLWLKESGIFFSGKKKYPEVNRPPAVYFLKDIIKDSLWAQTFVFQSQNDCWASWFASVVQAGGMCNKQESKWTKGKCFYLQKFSLFVWKRKITFSRTLTIPPSRKAGTWPSPSSSHCGVWGVCTHLPTCIPHLLLTCWLSLMVWSSSWASGALPGPGCPFNSFLLPACVFSTRCASPVSVGGPHRLGQRKRELRWAPESIFMKFQLILPSSTRSWSPRRYIQLPIPPACPEGFKLQHQTWRQQP